MKKNIVKLLLLCQVLWVFHGGVVLSKNSTSIENESYSYNYGGFYGLVKIACTTFVESINRVVEVSCDLPVFPNEESKQQPVQKVYLCFISLSANITNLEKITNITKYVLSLNVLQNFQLSNFNFTLNYLWLMFLFLYIYRLRYFFSRARSSIENSGIVIRGIVVKNPNCFWEHRSFQEQLGFFYCIVLIKNIVCRVFCFVVGVRIVALQIKNLFTETSDSESDLELFYTVCKSKKVNTLFTNFLFITKQGGAII